MSTPDDDADEVYVGGPAPVEELMPLPEIPASLDQPEHDGSALGDFAETIIDADGELEPDVLAEPPASDD